MAAQHTIGIDLGGTYIKGGVCDAGGRIVAKHMIETEAERGCQHVVQRMAHLVTDLIGRAGLAKTDIVGVGVGAPGPMSHAQGIIHSMPNLPGWVHVPLRDMFAEVTGLRVVLENDANAAAYGEYVAGAGQAVHSLVMLTLGTGIGGGIVLEGRLWRGAFDNAGEIGHTIIVPGGRACPCGQRGCFERYGSANAVVERLQEAIAAGERSSLAVRLAGGETVDARHVLEAQQAGDVLAARIWDETCFYLALGVINLQHAFNPELVVLAGGLINAGEALLQPMRAHFDREVWTIAKDMPRIAYAALGTDAGMVGAAALARPMSE